ncbi:MAG: DUF993 family protein [Planctomycetota bacterium]
MNAAAKARVGRLCYGAVHVVARESAAGTAVGDRVRLEDIDWDSTMRVRRALLDHGIRIAEAMDTAQRFEIGWELAAELIRRTARVVPPMGFCAGAGADQVAASTSLSRKLDAVIEQCEFITSLGGVPVILPMPFLVEEGLSEDGYVDAYAAIVRSVRGPIFLHWLGEAFAPTLAGYFPGHSFERILALDPSVVRGCKLSLLDPAFEEAMRRRLLANEQIVLTGDDFHFASLIVGDGTCPQRTTRIGELDVALGDFSHALLGVVDAIHAPMAAALDALAAGDPARALRLLEPCEVLGQHVFAEPTMDYKAGLAFLAWLNGIADGFALPKGAHQRRDRDHLLRVAELAQAAGAVVEKQVFAERLARFAIAP